MREKPHVPCAFSDEPIAIVAVGGVLPGGLSARAFMAQTASGQHQLLSSKPQHWLYGHQVELQPADAMVTEAGFFLDPELVAHEPGADILSRVMSRSGREVFEQVDLTPALRRKTAVVLGHIVLPTQDSTEQSLGLWSQPAVLSGYRSDIADRPAQWLKQHFGLGPLAYTLDAACASSLYAIKDGVELLQAGHCDAVLAGGVSLADSFYTQIGFSQLGALAAGGQARPFDKAAAGLLVGQGCGLFLLRRLCDAKAAGEPVLAVIRGVGVSSDDAQKGLLAPSSEGQQRAIQAAYTGSGLSLDDMDYIECHATGTPLGDQVEYQSLAALRQNSDKPVVLSSVKGQAGHLLTAAGASSLLRVLGCFAAGVLPATYGFEQTAWPLDHKRFEILKEPKAWPLKPGAVRRAAINGFGFGGINAHLVIEQSAASFALSQPSLLPRPPQLFADQEVVVVGLASACGQDQDGHCLRGQSLDIPLNRYKIPPKEMSEILLQQWLMLEVALAAWQQAGLPRYGHSRAAAYIGVELDPRSHHFHGRWQALAGGACAEIADKLAPQLNAPGVLGHLAAIAGSRLARELGCRGSGYTMSAGAHSGLLALWQGVRQIARGAMDIAVVGGVDICSHPLVSGQMLGTEEAATLVQDSAVALVLMRGELARQRGLPVYASLAVRPTQEDFVSQPQPIYRGAVTALADFYSQLVMETAGGSWSYAGPGFEILVQPQVSFVPASLLPLEPETTSWRITAERSQAGVFALSDVAKSPAWEPLPASRQPAQSPMAVSEAKPFISGESFMIKEGLSLSMQLPCHEELGNFAQIQAAHDQAHAAYLRTQAHALHIGQQCLEGVLQSASYQTVAISESALEAPELKEFAEPVATWCLTPKGRAPFNPQQPLYDYEQCATFASGRIADVLGPAFAPVDGFESRVRLPEGPLLLCHRIMAVTGQARGMKAGTLVTEHDIHADIWYLDQGRIPLCIAVEAGQADLFLSAYLGADFVTRGERWYRLLDAEVEFLAPLPGPGKTIRYEIAIERFFSQSGVLLFRFGFEATVDGEVLMRMKNGCAGFFTPAELAAGKGIVRTAHQLAPAQGRVTGGFSWPLHVSDEEALTEAQLDKLRLGDFVACFGESHEGICFANPYSIPGGMLRLVYRIKAMTTQGGRFGLGYVHGEADIQPDDWFLECHFKDDMVMPGTLMYECCLQTLRVFLMRIGWVGSADELRADPLPGVASRLQCRGQVLATTRTVGYEITVKEIGYNPDAYVICEAVMTADGKPIVYMDQMTLYHKGWGQKQVDKLWGGELPGQTAARVATPAQILEFCEGLPSRCFGPAYEVFDHKRFCARLPRPPYLFLDEVVSVSSAPLRLESGGTAVGYYQIPEQPWFLEQGQQAWPYAVLNEIALQLCGFYAAYMGSALSSDEDLKFRNLGGQAWLLRPQPIGRQLRIEAQSTNIASSLGMILQNYDFAVYDDQGLFYHGHTHFGFFSPQALADQQGLKEVQVIEPKASGQPLALQAQSQSLAVLGQSQGFWPEAGAYGCGYARASYEVDPQAWFFAAHFYQDPVMPGSLGLQAFNDLLLSVALHLFPNTCRQDWSGPAWAGEHQWTYRGQVIPEAAQVVVELSLLESPCEHKTLRAEGYLWVDGLRIYKITGLGISRTQDGE